MEEGKAGKLTTHAHQALRNSQPAMRAHHTQTRNMTMLHTIGRLFLHLRQNIPHHLGILAGDITRYARSRPGFITVLGPNNGYKAQLRPCQGVVEVVFEEVVLGEVGDVAGLN